jgi:hypothetical protein
MYSTIGFNGEDVAGQLAVAGIFFKIKVEAEALGDAFELSRLVEKILGPFGERFPLARVFLLDEPLGLVEMVKSATVFHNVGDKLAMFADELGDLSDTLDVLIFMESHGAEILVVVDGVFLSDGLTAFGEHFRDLSADVVHILVAVNPFPVEYARIVVGEGSHIDAGGVVACWGVHGKRG